MSKTRYVGDRMKFEVKYSQEDDDKLNAYLESILIDSVEAEREMLEKSGDRLKALVEIELNKIRRSVTKRYKDRPAMADDVRKNIRTGKWGHKYVRVSGGKKTGTLWHLVNDGTLHTHGTHFMDKALQNMDKDIDKIWDETLK